MLERGEEEEPDAVKMSTLHASKGLEYPHVYRPASRKACCRTGQGRRSRRARGREPGHPHPEERRLMYVGITRAQRSLNLSWCKRRRRAREDVVREPSRFIEEMGLDDPAIKEDEVTAAMNPKERLGMLKALLKK